MALDLLCAFNVNSETPPKVIAKWLENVLDPEEFFDHVIKDDDSCGNSITDELHNADSVVGQEVFEGWSKVQGEEWCKLTFANGDYFEGFVDMENAANREGVLVRLSDHGAVTSAKWRGDALEGLAVIESPSKDGWTKGHYSRGRPNGILRKFGPSKERKEDNLRMVAFYQGGLAVGTAWKGLVGGGFLVGSLDEEGDISGKRCAYLYPDLSTAIVGRFESDRLISGVLGKVSSVSFENCIAVLDIEPNQTNRNRFTRDVSTNKCISRSPMLRDPYEETKVEVLKSELPMAGEGLFAKTHLKQGELVALYNGIRLESGRNDGDWSGYRVRVNGEYDVDLPYPISDLDNYCATLAHKSNHAFGDSSNAKWTRLDHPRFGMISALKAKRNIAKSEEILVDYGLDMAEAPDWYKELFVKRCREIKNMTDEEIVNWCKRQHRIKGKWCDLPI